MRAISSPPVDARRHRRSVGSTNQSRPGSPAVIAMPLRDEHSCGIRAQRITAHREARNYVTPDNIERDYRQQPETGR